MDVLFWRDIRLQSVEDFLLIMNNIGSSKAFVDFDIRMHQLAKVKNPSLLDYVLTERNLVNRLLGLPEVAPSDYPAQPQENEQVANDFTMGAADETQVHKAQKSEDQMTNSSIDSDSIQIIQASLQAGVREVLIEQIQSMISAILEKTIAA